MIMQRIDFDGQDDPVEPPLNSEQSGFLYCFVPQNRQARQLRLDDAHTNEILIQRKTVHDMICEAFDPAENGLYFG